MLRESPLNWGQGFSSFRPFWPAGTAGQRRGGTKQGRTGGGNRTFWGIGNQAAGNQTEGSRPVDPPLHDGQSKNGNRAGIHKSQSPGCQVPAGHRPAERRRQSIANNSGPQKTRKSFFRRKSGQPPGSFDKNNGRNSQGQELSTSRRQNRNDTENNTQKRLDRSRCQRGGKKRAEKWTKDRVVPAF